MDTVIDPLAPRLTAAVTRYLEEHRLPGIAAGVVRDGALAWSTGIGFADRAAGRPMDERTLVRVASITKTVTATAVLQLRDEGRLTLDDPLVAHVPEARAIENPFGAVEAITIRRLLMHTSGLQGEVPSDSLDEWAMLTPDELLARLDRVRVAIPPESAYKYSNLAYELLGAVIARVTGEPVETYVRRAVLDPAGMTSTVFEPTGDLAARCAVGYDARDHDDDLPPARLLDSRTMVADGGLWSCVEDLARWIVAQTHVGDDDRRGDDGRVLDGSTLREMHRPTFLTDPSWEEAQGLGWYSIRRDGPDVWTAHGGSLDGFRSIVLFRAADGVGVVGLTNGSVPTTKLGLELGKLVLEAHRAAGPARPTAPPVAPPPEIKRLLGTYREVGYGDDVRIEWRDGRLVIAADDDPESPYRLEATDDPLVFTVRGGRQSGEPCTFLEGESGEVDRLNLGGYPMIRLVLARPKVPWRS